MNDNLTILCIKAGKDQRATESEIRLSFFFFSDLRSKQPSLNSLNTLRKRILGQLNMETLLYASDTLAFALVAFKAPQASINCCVSFCKKTSSGSFLQFAPNVQVWADGGLKVGKCVGCGLDHVMVSLVPVLQAAGEDQDVEILEPMMATPMKEDTAQFHSASWTLDGAATSKGQPTKIIPDRDVPMEVDSDKTVGLIIDMDSPLLSHVHLEELEETLTKEEEVEELEEVVLLSSTE